MLSHQLLSAIKIVILIFAGFNLMNLLSGLIKSDYATSSSPFFIVDVNEHQKIKILEVHFFIVSKFYSRFH